LLGGGAITIPPRATSEAKSRTSNAERNSYLDKVSLAIRQKRAALVAEFQFRQRMDKIRWEEEVLKPELEKLREQITISGTIPEFLIESGEDHTDHNPT
jgi:hypothetical protein